MPGEVLLHGVTGAPGSRLHGLLGEGLEPVAPMRGVRGCLPRVVVDVSGPEALLSPLRGRLRDDAARPEALAVLAQDAGHRVRWGEPRVVDDLRALLALCHARGRASAGLIVREPSLLSRLQVGAWFDAPWRTRVLRRGVSRRPPAASALPPRASRRWVTGLADLAFWAGVRQTTTEAEWRRVSRASYVALVYHRFAGEEKPGQERIDIAPARFARHLLALRLTGFRPCSAPRLLAFHETGGALPRRAVAVTVDDATADCLAPLRRHAAWDPQLFAPTAEIGGRAHWLDGEPLATWAELRELVRSGVAVGSHARHHRPLGPLGDAARTDELEGSLRDLRDRLPAPLEIVAFPNGDHDARLCLAAREAGYRAAYTTAKGRNGAGTDPHGLRRVSVHAADGPLAVLWKASTGEGLPAGWLRWRTRMKRLRR